METNIVDWPVVIGTVLLLDMNEAIEKREELCTVLTALGAR